MSFPPPLLPETLPATRTALQQVAVHVLARRRHAATGRFGLRPAPGGIATPAFGDDVEVLRTCGRYLVIEQGATTVTTPLETLGRAAEAAGVDLAAHFSVGDDTPAPADPAAPLAIDDAAALVMGEWYAFGSSVIDEVVASTPAIVGSTTRQIWPEHFDLGGAVTLAGAGDPQANVGASPGDGFDPLPYLYLGPWTGDRPGDPAYWNAPFGAVLRAEQLVGLSPTDGLGRAAEFFRHGLDLLG
ncbi:MAG TPA: hypothetical protein VGO78_24680 [Acidimicrobiales bacterium]|nr:hypothetical protein [Acidimicrobiales bacterium]